VSNAQKRAAHRHRNKTYPGPMTPADHALHAERYLRLRQLYAMRDRALAEQAQENQPPAPVVPTSGPGRRRAKNARRTQ
jgi:hypothetical protein